MGVGSAYLNLQVLGGQILGGILIVIGAAVAVFANQSGGKIVGVVIAAVGILMIWGVGAVKETMKEQGDESYETYGLIILVMALVGGFFSKINKG